MNITNKIISRKYVIILRYDFYIINRHTSEIQKLDFSHKYSDQYPFPITTHNKQDSEYIG